MLTRSPAHPRSSNASPSVHTFHYAPASTSPHVSSPSRLSAAASRRQSANSPSSVTAAAATAAAAAVSGPGPIAVASAPGSPPPKSSSSPDLPLQRPRRKRYVAVDAATQYSPMEPINYMATLHAKQSLQRTPPPLPPTPGPKPMTPGIEQGATPASGPATEDARARQSAAPSTSAATAAVPSAASSSAAPHVPKSAKATSSVKRRNSQAAGASASGSGSGPPSTVQSPTLQPKRARSDKGPPKVLPLKYERCPVEDMVVLIAHMLGELIETNDALALKSGHLTRFHSRTAPGISVLEYLHRLAKHATLSPPLLLSMVYYIDRLCAMYPDFTINTLTVHRFLITAATVASKGLSDLFWNNTTYARVGGVRVQELKLLELEFLYRVDWRIVPDADVLEAYYGPLVERCPGYALEEESDDPGDDGEEVEDDELDEDDELYDEDDEEMGDSEDDK